MICETVDVIIPNYNKQPYICECLSSLLNQTYRDWRCVVVDSFSDDGSWEIIQDLAREDARFELYQIPKTESCYQAWNFGLEKVRNPYFCILTSDDIWHESWLETAIKSLLAYKDAVGAAAITRSLDKETQWGEISINNIIGDRFFTNPGSIPNSRNGIVSSVASYFLGPIYTSIHSLVMKSHLLMKGERFAEDVGSTADYEWYIRLGLYGDIIYHPEIEVGWRIYEGQATKPRNQEVNGKLVQKIHFRTREAIVQKLGALGDEFRAIAEHYDDRVLSYHYARPYWANLRDRPLIELPKFLNLSYSMPRELFMDCFFKACGKSFFVEESLATAQRFYNLMLNSL